MQSLSYYSFPKSPKTQSMRSPNGGLNGVRLVGYHEHCIDLGPQGCRSLSGRCQSTTQETNRIADCPRSRGQIVFWPRGRSARAEALDTPLGQIGTLHFERLHDDPERQSHIWIAPGWDYLVVKTVHVENGKPVEMILTGATIAGAPVIVSQ